MSVTNQYRAAKRLINAFCAGEVIVATKQQAKDLVLLRHPGRWVQVLDTSKGYFEVKVRESEEGTAIASYSVKTW